MQDVYASNHSGVRFNIYNLITKYEALLTWEYLSQVGPEHVRRRDREVHQGDLCEFRVNLSMELRFTICTIFIVLG